MPPLIAATTALRKRSGAAPGIACEWPCVVVLVCVLETVGVSPRVFAFVRGP